MSAIFQIVHRVDNGRVEEALQRFPGVMARNLDAGAGRAAQEVAREERRRSPKAFSTLTNSIKADRLAPMRYEVGPHVQYAGYPETGTGPGGIPSDRALRDWIRVKRITPRDPGTTQEDLVFLIGRKILERGVRKQAYVEQTAKKMESRVHKLISDAAESGLREVGML